MGLFSLETQRRLNEEDRHWRVQLSLRTFATILAFPAFILFAAATSKSKQDYGGDDWVDAFPLAPILLALIYDPLHIHFLTSRTHHRPIHPVVPLILDLHIWALAVPAIVFSVGDGWFWYWQPATFSIDGDIVLCDFEGNWASEQCNPMIYTLGRVEIAANVFLALILIAHFTLFIYDCIATHHLRLSRARARRSTIPLTYHRDPAAHAAGAAPAPPPAYTPSSTTNNNTIISQPTSDLSQPTRGGHPHHQPSSSISKSVISSHKEEGNWGTRGGPPSPPTTTTMSTPRGGGWERNADGAPQLSSPVSPVNSGSGGGFMGREGDGGAFADPSLRR